MPAQTTSRPKSTPGFNFYKPNRRTALSSMAPKFAVKTPSKPRGKRKEKPPPPPPWIDLPVDITANILHRLGAVEMLETAQKVCKTWRGVCMDPAMWRVIEIRIVDDLVNKIDFVELCRHAVDRSQGQLVEINLKYFASDELLDYIAARSGNLRRLGLSCCYNLSNGCLLKALKRFPHLQTLDVSVLSNFSGETIEMVGRSCPSLTSFALNKTVLSLSCRSNDEEALAIARSMPELRCLKLVRNGLTYNGLEAIVDGCPHLETLDLRACFYVKLKGVLEKRFKTSIKCIKYSVS